jgi:sulfotransferase
MEKIYFLSGLQRSGSTVISCILGQNPSIHVTPTSPLLDILHSANSKMDECVSQYTFNYELIKNDLTSGIINSFYKHIKNPYVIDKHRGWPKTINLLKDEYHDPKILCTIRPVPEILASFIKLIEKNKSLNNDADKYLRSNGIPITITNRCDYFFNNFIKFHIDTVNEVIQNHKDNIHLVEYNCLVYNPEEEIKKIYTFFDLPHFKHNFDYIENICKEEKDINWGIDNLHIIRNKLEKTSTPPEEILGKELTEYYSQFDIKY